MNRDYRTGRAHITERIRLLHILKRMYTGDPAEIRRDNLRDYKDIILRGNAWALARLCKMDENHLADLLNPNSGVPFLDKTARQIEDALDLAQDQLDVRNSVFLRRSARHKPRTAFARSL